MFTMQKSDSRGTIKRRRGSRLTATSSMGKVELLLVVVVTLVLPCATQARAPAAECKPFGFLTGNSHGHDCEECCRAGEKYPKFSCSPPVTSSTEAQLTVNDFSAGGDGGGASSCDSRFHDGRVEKIVALSTGWFDNRRRCTKDIIITANGRSVRAKVVDECDSRAGCDDVHAFQPPCQNNIVDGSEAVWKDLGISKNDPKFGLIKITWKDA